METPKNSSLEVTGVSRSGRVCKKSSKLMDFQSPDEIEAKIIFKPQKISNKLQMSPSMNNSSAGLKAEEEHHYDGPAPDETTPYKIDEEPDIDDQMDMELEPDQDSNENDSNDDTANFSEDGDEGNLSIMEEDDEPMAKKSIYMTEKTSKKKMLKDGKIVFGKAQRKDKGKTRFTAYMLWAKDTRKHITGQNPDHDFASMSKRLGEMWGNVPETQKYNWRRRAKRLATKMRKDSLKAKALAGAIPSPYATKYATSRSTSRREPTRPEPVATPKTAKSEPVREKLTLHSPSSPPLKSELSPKYSPNSMVFKQPTANAADVAAHLKLLGDSLTIIGERLKEHEGQITVSGSLSVLLDSLLCSLGPLICLTTHIPIVGEQLDLKDTFSNTLDNIAYVMPGL